MPRARIPTPWSPHAVALERKLARLRRLHRLGKALPSSKAEQRALLAALPPGRNGHGRSLAQEIGARVAESFARQDDRAI